MRCQIALGGSLLGLSIIWSGAFAHAEPSAPEMPAGDSIPESDTAIAKKLQNPVGDLNSIPFRSETNFNYGPHRGTQDILHVPPVIPIHITGDWNIITRIMLPLIWQPWS
jgi:hypothetical protein